VSAAAAEVTEAQRLDDLEAKVREAAEERQRLEDENVELRDRVDRLETVLVGFAGAATLVKRPRTPGS
jgi:predicted  nucleic acid-binding Zn-ribbon protein